ncbi:MAG TPA: rhodanese-like domain-containing protein [Agriterribacter sp.]|nr:rhodanese-like domain-containing protein [Chitinophagaceae bacterium]HRP30850.1 rhodanese-like domain-containing protein [Agriterribacter sp.]
MFSTLKSMFGLGTQPDFSTMVKEGALILDVRSKGEFSSGHIKNAINIPVDQLSSQLVKLKDKNQCIICCCASGMRSGNAKRILESNGYKTVYNGGGWSSLQHKL